MTNPYEYYNETVAKIGELNLEGNIIPHNWYKHITFESGKADLNAIIILSEIVYWYRPTVVKDEATGRVLGTRKKFKSDLLQRSYESFADQFGLTKRQVSEAIKRLEKSGLLERVFRNFVSNGMKLSNVLFIKLNADKVKEITVFDRPSNIIMGEGIQQEGTPHSFECQTNTEITQEITTESITSKPKRYSISETENGATLFKYYEEQFEEHFNKPHPTVTKGQLDEIGKKLDKIMQRLDLDDWMLFEIIDYHFDNLPSGNDGKIFAFLGENEMVTPIIRYADDVENYA